MALAGAGPTARTWLGVRVRVKVGVRVRVGARVRVIGQCGEDRAATRLDLGVPRVADEVGVEPRRRTRLLEPQQLLVRVRVRVRVRARAKARARLRQPQQLLVREAAKGRY